MNRCQECSACQEWLLDAASAPPCENSKSSSIANLSVPRHLAATARTMVGRTIVRVQLRPFNPETAGQRDGDPYATNPLVYLDDGSVLAFYTQETEIGEYGIGIWRKTAKPKRKPRAKKDKP